jgi:ADP-heptose:LPS heptosyltransferase
LSASTSLLDRLRRGDPPPLSELRTLGEEFPGDFFHNVIEPLADSFDPVQSALYDGVMLAWDLHRGETAASVPDVVDSVYVLSRVTLGADIKITSMILDAMKQRFPQARIVFVAGRKSIQLFEADPRLEFLEADYPRTGPVSARIAFGYRLSKDMNARLETPNRIVVDPDSRMTQLGLIPVCEKDRYFHFPSRTAGASSLENLTDLTGQWLTENFGRSGSAYVAPKVVALDHERPAAAISLGVGENESKRVAGDFEARLIRQMGQRYRTVYVDRGAGGAEAQRVTAAVEASGVGAQVRFHEGSFAAFVSIIMQSDSYAGYDSAGQHAAAAAGIPLLSIFAGAPSEVFRARWAPSGTAPRTVLNADEIVLIV